MNDTPTDRPTVAAAFEAMLAFLRYLMTGGPWPTPGALTAHEQIGATAARIMLGPFTPTQQRLAGLAVLRDLVQAAAFGDRSEHEHLLREVAKVTELHHAARLEADELRAVVGTGFCHVRMIRSVSLDWPLDTLTVAVAGETYPADRQADERFKVFVDRVPVKVEAFACEVVRRPAAAELPALTEEPPRPWLDERGPAPTRAQYQAYRASFPRSADALDPSPAARRAAGETGHGMVVQTRGVDDAGRVWAGAGVRAAEDAALAARIRVNRDAVAEGRDDDATRAGADAAGAQAFAAVVEWPALVDTAKGRRETAADYPDDKGALIADLIVERVHVGVDPGGPDETVVHSSEPAFDRLERAVEIAHGNDDAEPWCLELREAWAAFTTARAATVEVQDWPDLWTHVGVGTGSVRHVSVDPGGSDTTATVSVKADDLPVERPPFMPGTARWERAIAAVDRAQEVESIRRDPSAAWDEIDRLKSHHGVTKGLVAERDSLRATLRTIDVELDHTGAPTGPADGSGVYTADARVIALGLTCDSLKKRVEALQAFALGTWSPTTQERVDALSGALSKLPPRHPAHDAWIHVQDSMGQHRADLQALAADDKAAS